jgi:hypothetical protein
VFKKEGMTTTSKAKTATTTKAKPKAATTTKAKPKAAVTTPKNVPVTPLFPPNKGKAYTIKFANAPTNFLSGEPLPAPNPAGGASVYPMGSIGIDPTKPECQWLLQSVPGTSNVYTIQNVAYKRGDFGVVAVATGSYLRALKGSRQVHFHGNPKDRTCHWIIDPVTPSNYNVHTIQSVETDMYLSMKNEVNPINNVAKNVATLVYDEATWNLNYA